MRCFIAIDIDEVIKKKIGAVREELCRAASAGGREVKWVEPGNIHLTLKFLGDVKDSNICEVCRFVEAASEGHERFFIEVKGLGVFGNPARVLWAGIEPSERLLGLYEDIEKRFIEAGWAGEARKFTGHLTLCRIKSASAGRNLARLAGDYSDVGFGGEQVESVCVYKSDLTNRGPVYTVVSRSLLG